MRRASLGLAVIILLTVSITAASVEYPVVIREVAVAGNEEIRTREILEAVPFGASDEIEEADLRSAVQAIHDLGWFGEVYWDPDALTEGRVVFVVEENPVIERIVITGNDHRQSHYLLGVKIYDVRLMSTLRIKQILWGEEIR
ncbi:MAG TPA: hypothetical protein ENN96_02850, partial [Candidatus Acetothermia bacterium]|nr:hypothetical protein [Candidatus Acetothermia bacterium]